MIAPICGASAVVGIVIVLLLLLWWNEYLPFANNRKKIRYRIGSLDRKDFIQKVL